MIINWDKGGERGQYTTILSEQMGSMKDLFFWDVLFSESQREILSRQDGTFPAQLSSYPAGFGSPCPAGACLELAV